MYPFREIFSREGIPTVYISRLKHDETGGIRDMGGPKKPLPRDSPPGGYGWSKSGFPNTTYTLKFAINLRNEKFAYPEISKALKRERTTCPLWIGCPLFDLYQMKNGL